MDGFTEDDTVEMLPDLFTVCVTMLEALALKLVPPRYTAEIEWWPTARVEVANVALPAVSVAVASVVAPSLKATVPAGVPEPGALAVTVAVKVTFCPNNA